MKFSLIPLYNFFGGVTEFYAFIFTGISIYFVFKNLLSMAFVGAIGAIQAFVTANDVHNDLNVTNVNKDTTVTNVTVDTPPASGPTVSATPSPTVIKSSPVDGLNLPGGPH